MFKPESDNNGETVEEIKTFRLHLLLQLLDMVVLAIWKLLTNSQHHIQVAISITPKRRTLCGI